MKLRFWNYMGQAAIFFAGGMVVAHAAEPARQQNTPIIFSEPKAGTVSSNLSQLDLKVTPFKGLESDLKKPFEIFDASRFGGDFRPPAGMIAPPAPVNNRRLKELIDKRAEMMLHGSDGGESDPDPFKAAEDSLDIAGRKLKTPLDRYYNRLDREREGLTNQIRNTDLFGNDKDANKDADGKNPFGRTFADRFFGGGLKASANSLGMSTNAVERGGFFSDNLKPKTFDDLLDVQRPNASSERSSSVKETRLDEFKRLLDRPAYTPVTNYYSPGLSVAGAAAQPVMASPWPTWASSPATADPRDSFTSRAGLVGAPPQLPSLPSFAATTPSLNPVPAPAPRPTQPPSSFSIPKRQF